jgi:hypothetical protein
MGPTIPVREIIHKGSGSLIGRPGIYPIGVYLRKFTAKKKVEEVFCGYSLIHVFSPINLLAVLTPGDPGLRRIYL